MRCRLFTIAFSIFLCITCYAEKRERNQGEVVSVDTSLYCFKIRDQQSNETRFFAPENKLKTISAGENVQVKYRKTTDGQLKALDIKPVKEKKKKRSKKESQ
ncbi:MAG: hypothetical protein NC937_03125 [Candidatus Omnitrophica bacterium]|nr:hypothetical protein [Candidatus Omnitrophota bacterium]MCM8821994.1 hypothetical protein [Candidatus Omnitrophota bacterium]MCM8825130.1 hypothetical protein [Candidatus Omnitrophota bacterium]MCM8828249.1 hypothetical protein [Candidatus Omnitrophota bacterium]